MCYVCLHRVCSLDAIISCWRTQRIEELQHCLNSMPQLAELDLVVHAVACEELTQLTKSQYRNVFIRTVEKTSKINIVYDHRVLIFKKLQLSWLEQEIQQRNKEWRKTAL